MVDCLWLLHCRMSMAYFVASNCFFAIFRQWMEWVKIGWRIKINLNRKMLKLDESCQFEIHTFYVSPAFLIRFTSFVTKSAFWKFLFRWFLFPISNLSQFSCLLSFFIEKFTSLLWTKLFCSVLNFNFSHIEYVMRKQSTPGSTIIVQTNFFFDSFVSLQSSSLPHLECKCLRVFLDKPI